MQQLQRNYNIWGAGRRTCERLEAMGIGTVQALRDAEPKMLRQHFGVVMERTANELRGLSCLWLEEVSPPKKQIVSSRSFGTMVESFNELREAVSTYVSRAAEKMRVERSVCSSVHVFVQTNRFLEQDDQDSNGISITLTQTSNDTRRLTAAALYGLKRLYRPGYLYKKAGVMLMDLSSESVRQSSLFSAPNPRSEKMMQVLDGLNKEYGKNTLYLASSGIQLCWTALFENRTFCYTTIGMSYQKQFADH